MITALLITYFPVIIFCQWFIHTNVAAHYESAPAVKLAEGFQLPFYPDVMMNDSLAFKSYGSTTNNRGGTFYHIQDASIIDQMFTFIKPEYRHSEYITTALLVFEKPLVAAHRDSHMSTCAINFYLDLADGYVVFYEEPTDPSTLLYLHPNGAELMNMTKLTETIRIVPQRHEVWLLNNRVVHSVHCADDMVETGQIRAMFRLQINRPFEEAKNMLATHWLVDREPESGFDSTDL